MPSTTPLQSIQFCALTGDQWRRFGVCEINHQVSDNQLTNTPYDPRLGALENGVRCLTCNQTNITCPGHFGFIPLEIKVFNPKFLNVTLNVLQCLCIECARPRVSLDAARLTGILEKKGMKRLNELSKASSRNVSQAIPVCEHCSEPLPNFRIDGLDLRIYYGRSKGESVTANQVYGLFSRVNDDTHRLLGFDPNPQSNTYFNLTALLFDVFPVIPTCARPWAYRENRKCDDHLTIKYDTIIKINNRLKADRLSNPDDIAQNPRKHGRLLPNDRFELENKLIYHIYTLIDNSKEAAGRGANVVSKGLRERLNGKQGRAQQNVNGKRVNFSMRSVITGGAHLRVGEIGIPPRAAKIETIMEHVSPFNISYLQKLVDDAKANTVIRPGGGRIRLSAATKEWSRDANNRLVCPFLLQNGDTVERHLRDGDWVLANRQPTLRPESMQAMQVRILPTGYECIQIPLAVTPPFGADFDGEQ